jgi:hypothetical protein
MLLDHFAHATYVERGKALLLLQVTAWEIHNERGGEGQMMINTESV